MSPVLTFNVMRYLLISLFFLFFFISCKNEDKKEGLLNKIENNNHFRSKSAKIIQGTEMFVDVILHPNRMEIGKEMLFVSCFKCDTMIYTFSLPNMELLSCFGQKGEGPEDFLFPVFCSSEGNNVSVWGGADLKLISQFEVNKDGNWFFRKSFELKENKPYNQARLLKDSFFIYNEFPPKLSIEKINLYDQDKTKHLKFDIDKEIKESFFQKNKGDLLASNNGIAYLYYYKDQIDFYDLNLNILVSHSNENSRVDVNSENYKNSQVYYVNSYAGDKYLYASKRGKPLSVLLNTSFGCIEVYDWNGNKITEFKPNPTPNLFVVDEKNSVLYGYNYDYPDCFFKYDLKEIFVK